MLASASLTIPARFPCIFRPAGAHSRRAACVELFDELCATTGLISFSLSPFHQFQPHHAIELSSGYIGFYGRACCSLLAVFHELEVNVAQQVQCVGAILCAVERAGSRLMWPPLRASPAAR